MGSSKHDASAKQDMLCQGAHRWATTPRQCVRHTPRQHDGADGFGEWPLEAWVQHPQDLTLTLAGPTLERLNFRSNDVRGRHSAASRCCHPFRRHRDWSRNRDLVAAPANSDSPGSPGAHNENGAPPAQRQNPDPHAAGSMVTMAPLSALVCRRDGIQDGRSNVRG